MSTSPLPKDDKKAKGAQGAEPPPAVPPTQPDKTGMIAVAEHPREFAAQVYGNNWKLSGQSLAAPANPKAQMLDVTCTDYWVKELAKEQSALNLMNAIKAENAKMYAEGAFTPGAKTPKKPKSIVIMFYEDGSILVDNILDRERTPNRDEKNEQTNSKAANKSGRPTPEQKHELECFRDKQAHAPGLTPYEKLATQYPNLEFRKLSVNQWRYKIDDFVKEDLLHPITGAQLWETNPRTGARVKKTRTKIQHVKLQRSGAADLRNDPVDGTGGGWTRFNGGVDLIGQPIDDYMPKLTFIGKAFPLFVVFR